MTVLDSSTEQALQAQAEQSANYLGADEFNVDDPLELIYKFIFDPKSKYQEINKLWSLTNLKETDVEQITNLAKNIRIYDQEKFKVNMVAYEGTGNWIIEEDAEGNRSRKQEYMEVHYYRSRFYELIEKDLGKIDSICAAAGGRKGSLVRAFRTTSLQQHQSLEDKTAPRSSWWGGSKKEK